LITSEPGGSIIAKALSIHKDNRCISTYELAVANLP
jgi:hypothetical protein